MARFSCHWWWASRSGLAIAARHSGQRWRVVVLLMRGHLSGGQWRVSVMVPRRCCGGCLCRWASGSRGRLVRAVGRGWWRRPWCCRVGRGVSGRRRLGSRARRGASGRCLRRWGSRGVARVRVHARVWALARLARLWSPVVPDLQSCQHRVSLRARAREGWVRLLPGQSQLCQVVPGLARLWHDWGRPFWLARLSLSRCRRVWQLCQGECPGWHHSPAC